MLAIILVFCFIKTLIWLFCPELTAMWGDFYLFFLLQVFFFFFGKGSDKLHRGILKCQLRMEINKNGEKQVRQSCYYQPNPRTAWYGPGAEWRLTGGQAGSCSCGGFSLFERQEHSVCWESNNKQIRPMTSFWCAYALLYNVSLKHTCQQYRTVCYKAKTWVGKKVYEIILNLRFLFHILKISIVHFGVQFTYQPHLPLLSWYCSVKDILLL